MDRKAVAQKSSAGVRIPYLPTFLLSDFPSFLKIRVNQRPTSPR